MGGNVTKTVRVARTFSESSKVTFYTVEEARCRVCGHTFRVDSADDRKFADAELCKVDYYEEGNGHEREGLCLFCDEPTKGKYCERHAAELTRFTSVGERAVRRAVKAMDRPPIADRWDAADFAERQKLLMLSGVGMYRVKDSKSIGMPWERVNPITRRRLAMNLDNVII